MASRNNCEYYIPENFVGESRLFQGRLSTRRLIDAGVVLFLLLIIALPLSKAVTCLFIQNSNDSQTILSIQVFIIVFLCAPGTLLSYIGYNDDPSSVFVKNYCNWCKTKETRIYNENPRLLGTDPVKVMYESNQNMDNLISKFEEKQRSKMERKLNEEYIEGETFEFAYDPNIDDYLEDVGDFSDEAMTGDSWPVADVSISASNDLSALKFWLNNDSDGYNDEED